MSRLDRRALLAGSLAAAGSALLPGWAAGPGRRPSFLFILADDMGFGDVGCFGRDDVRTPAIDSLARDGMKFEQAYANSPICSPTRVGLITGRYQYRLPVGLNEPLGNNESLGLEPGTPTLPLQLKSAGYQTSLVGKWHMGSALRFSPLKNGYDHFWGLRGGAIDYFTHDNKRVAADGTAIAAPDLWDGDVPVTAVGYMTDLIGERAAREITRMSGDPRPFQLSVHFTAPHWPWETEADAELATTIRNNMHYDGGTIATYRAMIESLDANVARILAALKAGGRAGDTIVVFTSDNGGERFAKTWPYNGMKAEVLEGGIRTPLLVRWPGRVARGQIAQQVAISMDWVPTFLEAAGISESQRAPTDGMSLLPALLERRTQDRSLFWRFKAHDQAAARFAQWKYLRMEGHEFLFDVIADPQERGNLKAKEPARFASLKTDWQKWNAEMLPYPADSLSQDNTATHTIPERF